MEIIGWGAAYFAFATFCYYSLYANAVDLNCRLRVPFDEKSWWQDFIAYNKGVLELLALDFLKIHCPWSKAVSIRYRVQEVRSLLQHMTHEKGWTAESCDNPANHRQIAKDCFLSRTRFWARGIFMLLTSPLRMVILMLILIVVLPIIGAGSWIINLIRR
ncbi:MAG: hypothetical protein A2939_05180 [Parcubacteria group bacterium RIFCSPLOWO2_01_FULL_48_18]|nr:MAG: hypothetical protein A2939_05180 [Parcubacteria group bacterium RIFCSPLOWO2_01_FULL_48_18]OHB22793.1 MAG: hypothetical protein A3J67_06195 [Parcubacteria group bacterium RIFCSPHIGHO2_02_FULL_48_10b]